MAHYSPWVLTALTWLNDGATTTLTAVTDKPDHLHTVYQSTYPTRTPRLIRRRGALIECGLWVSWPHGACTEQTEPGLTTTHTFHLPPVTPPDHLYCSVTAICPPLYGYQQSIPFDVAAEVTELPLPAISCYSPSVSIPSTGLHAITWASAIHQLDWPGQTFPASFITFPANGIVQVAMGILWPATGTQYNAAGFLEWGTNSPWLETDLTEATFGNGSSQTISAAVLVAAGETMRVRVAQSSGSNKTLGPTDGQTLYLTAAYIRLTP